MARQGHFLLGWVIMVAENCPTRHTLIAAASAKKSSVVTLGKADTLQEFIMSTGDIDARQTAHHTH
jgi:hypothetical protein